MADRWRPTSGPEWAPEDDLVAIPRLAERVGVTPRVLRYWEERGLISPTREHGNLRYSPRDIAIAGLTKRLIDAGASVDGLLMLKDLSEREVRRAGADRDQRALAEIALRILHQRKAFRETTGLNDEHFPDGGPDSRPHGPGSTGHPPGPKRHGPRHDPDQHAGELPHTRGPSPEAVVPDSA